MVLCWFQKPCIQSNTVFWHGKPNSSGRHGQVAWHALIFENHNNQWLFFVYFCTINNLGTVCGSPVDIHCKNLCPGTSWEPLICITQNKKRAMRSQYIQSWALHFCAVSLHAVRVYCSPTAFSLQCQSLTKCCF